MNNESFFELYEKNRGNIDSNDLLIKGNFAAYSFGKLLMGKEEYEVHPCYLAYLCGALEGCDASLMMAEKEEITRKTVEGTKLIFLQDARCHLPQEIFDKLSYLKDEDYKKAGVKTARDVIGEDEEELKDD